MRLELARYNYAPEYTEGRLFHHHNGVSEFICWTLELAWHNNRPSESCIPDGRYGFRPWQRPSGEWAFMIEGNGCVATPDRLTPDDTRCLILIHAANRPSELRGCIAPGLTREPGHVWNSRRAMRKLHGLTAAWFTTHRTARLLIRQQRSPALSVTV